MLPGTYPIVGSKMVAISHVATPTPSTTDTNSYTFSSVSLGSGQRFVLVAFAWGSGGTTTPTTVTIAGVAASLCVRSVSNVASNAAIYGCALSGAVTTGDIVISFDSTASRCAPVVYQMVGARSIMPFDTLTQTATDPMSGTIDIPANGAVLGEVAGGNGSGTTAWTGLTEDTDQSVEGRAYSSAHQNFMAGETGRAITADFSSSPGANTSNFAVASWQP